MIPAGTVADDAVARPAVLGDDELAGGWCFERSPPVVPEIAPRDPRSVLEEEILRALQASPCIVSFSGGCDSGCILALAVHLARREGLPEPIAMTERYPNAHPDENEDSWQEFVIRELAVTEWERIEVPSDEIIGESSARLCARGGVLWPPFFHTYEPLIARARGGTLLTGEYGDEATMPADGALVADLLALRRRPSPRAVATALGWAGPRALRHALARRGEPRREWLCEPLRETVREAFAQEAAISPWRADVARRQIPVSRATRVWRQNMAFAAGPEVELVHPFSRQELFDSVAVHYGSRGPATRADVLRAWFGDCAPTTLIDRRSKGGYDSVYWAEQCRSFARSWEPRWWPSHLVDPELLRAAWIRDGFESATWTLMQLAWWSTRCEQGDAPRTLGEIARARPRSDETPGG